MSDADDLRAIVRDLCPEMTQAEFDIAWRSFEILKDQAAALKAQGVAIHPTFARARQGIGGTDG